MNRRVHLERLRNSAPCVLPSLLLCDFGNLEREIRQLEQAGVQALHLDVMDGNFVPNLTYGMPIVEAIRKLTDLPIDVHLMISKPEDYIRLFFKAGADLLTFHVEATNDPRSLLEEINSLGIGSGIALNPETSLSLIEPCLDVCDLALVMSVNAGFGGQRFNTIALDKLKRLKQIKRDELLLQVDGGINSSTISSCAQAGADLFVVGSAIFRQPDYSDAVSQLTTLIESND